jgi:hypothetical protein
MTRKLVHPLVAQYRRDGCAFTVRRRMRRIALARPTAAFAALRDSMGWAWFLSGTPYHA